MTDTARSSRFSDQPPSLRTRLCGASGIALATLAIAAGSLVTWTTFNAPTTSATLSVFDVAQPASPPEPQNETAPESQPVPEQMRPSAMAPPQIDLPQIPLQSPEPLPQPIVVSSPPAPAEPPDTPAPAREPAPPAPRINQSSASWEGLVMGALDKVKRYPRLAASRRQQGVPYIRFVMDREGNVLSSRLERSSGFSDLDREAVMLPKRAAPLPKPPASREGETVEVVVPVEFFLGR